MRMEIHHQTVEEASTQVGGEARSTSAERLPAVRVDCRERTHAEVLSCHEHGGAQALDLKRPTKLVGEHRAPAVAAEMLDEAVGKDEIELLAPHQLASVARVTANRRDPRQAVTRFEQVDNSDRLRSDGRPQLSPVVAAVDDDGHVLISTRETAVKAKNLARDPRASLCVINDGFAHAVASSELAVKTAALMGFREAYSSAKPSILEPIMKVEVEAPVEFQGSVVGQVNQRRGVILETVSADVVTVTAEVPLNTMFGYSTDLRSAPHQGSAPAVPRALDHVPLLAR